MIKFEKRKARITFKEKKNTIGLFVAAYSNE